uniref:Proline dehydrogenase n=1 Tax=Strigamia maritima TaxID=126957 RepID=T1J6H6_STRMM
MASLKCASYALQTSKFLIPRSCQSYRFTALTTTFRHKSNTSTYIGLDSLNDAKRQSRGANDGQSPSEPSSFDPLDISFENAERAYKSKSTWEIARALIVFSLCSNDYLVKNNMKIMKWTRKVLGKRLFEMVMRATVYGQFVAGEDQNTISPTLERLRQFGVKSILDYSVEEDLSSEQAEKVELEAYTAPTVDLKQYQPTRLFADRRRLVTSARTYFYMNEAQCEKNMEIFLKCIESVSGITNATGFTAIKLTALGRPQLLLQLSATIARSRKYFEEVTGLTGNIILQDIGPDVFMKRFHEKHISTDSKDIKSWLNQMTYDQKGLIHLFSWSGLIDSNILLTDLFRVPNLNTGRMENIISSLTEEEEEMFRNMMRRLRTIAQVATERDVRVMVDAEQSYFQPAISRITVELMRKYNKEKAIIFNTYQCYLKKALQNVLLDVEQASRQGFYFGAKLVRGAYMDQERERARVIGYGDPINPTYESTNDMYNRTLLECLQKIKQSGDKSISVMVATHNEDTIRFAVTKMKELGIGPRDRVVCFGQLYGMCDQVSFPLGQSGYSVYKYVPYGPVSEVLPYLSRRAQENQGFFTKVAKERRLLKSELKRRILSGQIFYKPVGYYTPV